MSRKRSAAFVVAALFGMAHPSDAVDPWDQAFQKDDGPHSDNGLLHGTEQVHDLHAKGGVPDEDWYQSFSRWSKKTNYTSSFQTTNETSRPCSVTYHFYLAANGEYIHSVPRDLPAHGTDFVGMGELWSVIPPPGVTYDVGWIQVAHTCGYGRLQGVGSLYHIDSGEIVETRDLALSPPIP